MLTPKPTPEGRHMFTPILDAASSPKAASAIAGALGTGNLYLWKMQAAGSWLIENINFISGVVGISISIAIFCMQRSKIKRELEIANAEHAAKMKDFKRRSTDR